ncbi:TPA: PTS sugar transporter subunit IIA [Escherichia coli]|uniref:PTS sugar transporter subunit IIA n=1 Tax=Escherichia coli TaxID=562 RepID=UPI00182EA0B5|nr:PTS sugar transporter subunit IIA [Escherichia coli]EEZ5619971.1 PTS transporter subunit EIIA [Escherichia coli]EFH5360414.1 PTS galactitol transporter subunit IIA [Escherichia coli]EFP2265457.1 PTS transporter subunit EIIA [Escherichia coli]EIQ9164547.1 PTS sugar transporter subunit IIA [Escherichia coli]EIT0950788.1 PTS sugar transporter subunit IIA [Escherichia coli]
MTNLFVRSGISFVDRSEVLTHIGNEMLAKGVVHDTWPQALIAREAEFPTGIMLDYLLRPTNKVHFQQADDDNDVEVSLVIALIVENPQQQLKLLRCLFGKLQQPDIVETLITLPETKLKEYFTKYVLDSDE